MAKSKGSRQKKVQRKTAIDEMAPLSPPSPPVVDYNRPLRSPYTRSSTLRIGNDIYHIPAAYLDKYPKLQPRDMFGQSSTFDIDGDIGHTVTHFLYTGGYETLQTHPDVPVQDISREFQRAIQVYYAARQYEIHGLGELAKAYIEKLGDVLSIFTILQAVRKVHSRLPKDEAWLYDYLHAKLQGAFGADENTFSSDEFYSSLGDDSAFHQAVMKMVVSIYANVVSSLRAPAAESSNVEPVPELHVEPSDLPTPEQSGLDMIVEDPPAGPVEADEVPVEACVEAVCDLPAVTPLDDWGSPIERHSVPVC